MGRTDRTFGRRTVLKQVGLLGAGVVGSAQLARAQSSSEPVGAVLKKEPHDPISESEIAELHAEIEQRFGTRYGRELTVGMHPVSAETQALVAYAILVDETGTPERYHGLVTKLDSRERAVASQQATEAHQRHQKADAFINTGTYRIASDDTIDSDNFSDWGSVTNEFGDSDGGKVIMTSECYNNTDNDNVWGLGTNTQVIPGVNTEAGTAGLNESGRAEHRWDKSPADPRIIDRAPTGTKDGQISTGIDLSVSIGTDTSGSGTLRGTYTQPDLHFSSKGSTVSTELNWSYNQSSFDITWDTEYLSICKLGGGLDYRDLIVEDYYNGEFTNGPDASLGQTFQNVPYGGV
ncbi:hypothetical protein [Haloferax sp. Atlit-4N]|uniref:hypothetical protein n=1 Tax=Haloferax sp. Atlit-4N TaxID=2077206 RepID=UPI0011C03165|nr:hypothetical protein [Haloferax sp. Atlit-4N]